MTKTYGVVENTYRNGMDDLRKFGFVIDHQYDSYGLDFYCRSVAPPNLIQYVPKNRTGKKSEFGPQLKKMYSDLVTSELTYAEYNLEEQWLYQLGYMYDWPQVFQWKF